MSNETESLPFVACGVPPTVGNQQSMNDFTVRLNERFNLINSQMQRLTQGLYTKGASEPDFGVDPGPIPPPDIPDYSITAIKLADSAVVSRTILDGIITTLKIADSAVTQAKVAAAAIGSSQLIDGAVLTAKLADSGITSVKLADLAVDSSKLATNAVTNTKIADGAISTPKLTANVITSNELAANAVIAGKIAANAVTAGTVAASVIGTNELIANAVTTAKLAAGAVTANELAANSVTSVKILAGTIQSGNIAAGAIQTGNLAAGAVTTNELAALAVTAAKIAANTITAAQIATGTITATQCAFTVIGTSNVVATINASTEGIVISGSKVQINGSTTFASGYDPTGKIATGGAAADVNANTTTIDGGKITTGTITATQISAGAITSDKLDVTSLSAITGNIGTITTGSITGTSINCGSGQLTAANSRFFMDAYGGTFLKLGWAAPSAYTYNEVSAYRQSGTPVGSLNFHGGDTGQHFCDLYVYNAASSGYGPSVRLRNDTTTGSARYGSGLAQIDASTIYLSAITVRVRDALMVSGPTEITGYLRAGNALFTLDSTATSVRLGWYSPNDYVANSISGYRNSGSSIIGYLNFAGNATDSRVTLGIYLPDTSTTAANINIHDSTGGETYYAKTGTVQVLATRIQLDAPDTYVYNNCTIGNSFTVNGYTTLNSLSVTSTMVGISISLSSYLTAAGNITTSSGAFYVGSNQVVGARGAAVAAVSVGYSPSSVYSTDTGAIYSTLMNFATAINALRSRLSTHGLIAT